MLVYKVYYSYLHMKSGVVCPWTTYLPSSSFVAWGLGTNTGSLGYWSTVPCHLSQVFFSTSTLPSFLINLKTTYLLKYTYWQKMLHTTKAIYTRISVTNQLGMVTTFPQCNFSLEFPELLTQNHICYNFFFLCILLYFMIDWVCLGFPKSCILGYSLTCPIESSSHMHKFNHNIVSMNSLCWILMLLRRNWQYIKKGRTTSAS